MQAFKHLRPAKPKTNDVSPKARSVYIGNRFGEEQYPFILAIASGYCLQRGVHVLLFESKPSDEVLNHPEVQKITDGLELTFLNEEKRSNSNRPLSLYAESVLSLPKGLILAWRCSRTQLLDSTTDWFHIQQLHAIWDQALQSAPDGTLRMPYWRLLLAGIKILNAQRFARRILKKFSVTSAFLGHTVYKGRATLAEFRRAGVEVFAQAAGVVYRLPKYADVGATILSEDEWEVAFSILQEKELETFWRERSIGIASYEDATLAASGKTDIETLTPRNLLLLHIFRDSPFNAIDRSRIFADYVEWIQETLEILALSEERWMIRPHPSAGRWGENQSVWIQEILKRSLGESSAPKNVKVIDTATSNLALFRHVQRVVTFNGTAHLEAACFGIRPVVIADVTLNSLDERTVHKPSSKSSYREMLLKPADSRDFRLGSREVELARKALFVREEMLSLQTNVGYLTRYRGDPRELLKDSLNAVLNKSPEFSQSLHTMGKKLALGIPRTTRIEFFEEWATLLEKRIPYSSVKNQLGFESPRDETI